MLIVVHGSRGRFETCPYYYPVRAPQRGTGIEALRVYRGRYLNFSPSPHALSPYRRGQALRERGSVGWGRGRWAHAGWGAGVFVGQPKM